MSREDIQKLLAGYATGTLTEAEQGALFEEALKDQQIFDALADEEAMRELLADAEVRGELLAALDEPGEVSGIGDRPPAMARHRAMEMPMQAAPAPVPPPAAMRQAPGAGMASQSLDGAAAGARLRTAASSSRRWWAGMAALAAAVVVGVGLTTYAVWRPKSSEMAMSRAPEAAPAELRAKANAPAAEARPPVPPAAAAPPEAQLVRRAEERARKVSSGEGKSQEAEIETKRAAKPFVPPAQQAERSAADTVSVEPPPVVASAPPPPAPAQGPVQGQLMVAPPPVAYEMQKRAADGTWRRAEGALAVGDTVRVQVAVNRRGMLAASLEDRTLFASAVDAGQPIYIPAEGSIPSTAGLRTLRVTFTPQGAANVTAESAPVTGGVRPGALGAGRVAAPRAAMRKADVQQKDRARVEAPATSAAPVMREAPGTIRLEIPIEFK